EGTYGVVKRIIDKVTKEEKALKIINKNIKDIIDWGCATEIKDQPQTEILGTNLYISPEVLLKKYTHKCDIWSAGVILYILLCGEPPFTGNQQEIYKKILQLQYDMDEDIWQSISDEAKDLIKKMLCPEEKRLCAKEIQEHTWLKKFAKLSKAFEVFDSDGNGYITLDELKDILGDPNNKNSDIIEQIIQNIDKDNDGKISFEEFHKMMEKYAEQQQ
ncbi:hypothetical protein IMG5_039240, partial [Ichthyophthirius multifiliis]